MEVFFFRFGSHFNLFFFQFQTLASSELVQLLKTPKPESEVVVELPITNGVSNHNYVANAYIPSSYIPPPKPSDYQVPEDKKSSFRGLTGTAQYAEHRRNVHINAEQNRRTSIKHGFEELRALIPSLRDVSQSSHKISKAALLHKGGDYIREMKGQCDNMNREAVDLRRQIESLGMEVSGLQGLLPSQRQDF